MALVSSGVQAEKKKKEKIQKDGERKNCGSSTDALQDENDEHPDLALDDGTQEMEEEAEGDDDAVKTPPRKRSRA